MNYIGSKYKLLNFIKQTIGQVVGQDLSTMTFCDLFAGTGIVGRAFKGEVKHIISNDMEYYSYVLNKNYIENTQPITYQPYIDTLDTLTGIEGFIFNQYSQGGTAQRLYFTTENGKKIDAIRLQLEQWRQDHTITENLYYFLLASLIESADKIANTASVYGAFLKHIKPTAQKKLCLLPALFEPSLSTHQVFQQDSNQLIEQISGDILYLDPPYNTREYGANYHLLNTIALYDTFEPKGKTGLRTYQKSKYCKKNQAVEAFEDLIQKANFKYIFLSYNNEGLMNNSTIKEIMSRYGKYHIASKPYTRFKADKQENRNHKANSTTEFLHILEK